MLTHPSIGLLTPVLGLIRCTHVSIDRQLEGFYVSFRNSFNQLWSGDATVVSIRHGGQCQGLGFPMLKSFYAHKTRRRSIGYKEKSVSFIAAVAVTADNGLLTTLRLFDL